MKVPIATLGNIPHRQSDDWSISNMLIRGDHAITLTSMHRMSTVTPPST